MAEIEESFLACWMIRARGLALEAYQDAQADATVERDSENFVFGFRLCARLIFESLVDETERFTAKQATWKDVAVFAMGFLLGHIHEKEAVNAALLAYANGANSSF